VPSRGPLAAPTGGNTSGKAALASKASVASRAAITRARPEPISVATTYAPGRPSSSRRPDSSWASNRRSPVSATSHGRRPLKPRTTSGTDSRTMPRCRIDNHKAWRPSTLTKEGSAANATALMAPRRNGSRDREQARFGHARSIPTCVAARAPRHRTRTPPSERSPGPQAIPGRGPRQRSRDELHRRTLQERGRNLARRSPRPTSAVQRSGKLSEPERATRQPPQPENARTALTSDTSNIMGNFAS
jgi:hypothetical protein